MGRLHMSTTVVEFKKMDGREADGEPLHYTACGLDDVYLVNGFTRETRDGEEFITIENLDGLWKAIGLYIVTTRKVLAPKEIRFLRDHMGLTQAQLGAHLRVSDQTVARWEKGETKCIPGPADFMLRVLFLASDRAQPEGHKILEKLKELSENIVERDEREPHPVTFEHGKRRWKETTKQLELA
jgi:DNA-binding transcriptional regulator YiaG